MSDDQFTKLFRYMQREFKAVRQDIAAVRTGADEYANNVDAFAKQNETYMQELLALGHIVDRHDSWIHQVAKASGVKLST